MSRNKNCKNYRQADSRWGGKTYPSAPYYMAGSGCGPTACADLIASIPRHNNLTPKTTRAYMVKRGYAVPGQGTAWNGIDACLKFYGFKVQRHTTMDSFFNEMKKSGRRAIILFRGGTRGGTTWTLGGHYVACSGMKIQNGKHYLYTLDPGPRHNDGWHAYETTMKGLVVLLWTCYIPTTKKTTTTKKPAAAKKPAETKKPAAKKETTKKKTTTTKKKTSTIKKKAAAVKKKVTNLVKKKKKKTVTTVAKEVILGKWGNGDVRKAKLKAAGYNYNEVQKEVDRLLKNKVKI